MKKSAVEMMGFLFFIHGRRKNNPAQTSRVIDVIGKKLLLQAFLNSNSQVNSHADHG